MADSIAGDRLSAILFVAFVVGGGPSDQVHGVIGSDGDEAVTLQHLASFGPSGDGGEDGGSIGRDPFAGSLCQGHESTGRLFGGGVCGLDTSHGGAQGKGGVGEEDDLVGRKKGRKIVCYNLYNEFFCGINSLFIVGVYFRNGDIVTIYHRL